MPEPETRRRALIAEIERVFDNVGRGDGTTLHETYIVDFYGTELERKRARKKDREARWQDVPDSQIAKHGNRMCFLDAKGLRYYLPAIMRWTLRHGGEHSASELVSHAVFLLLLSRDSTGIRKHQEELFAVFTEAESRTICRFLRFLSDEGGFGEPAGAAREAIAGDIPQTSREAIERYWGRFCGPL